MRLHSVLAVSFDGVRLDFFLRGLGMSSALVHLDRGGRGVLHSFVCRNRAVLRLAKALGELPHGVDQFASSGGGNAKRPGSVTRHGEASANFDRLGHVDDYNAGPVASVPLLHRMLTMGAPTDVLVERGQKLATRQMLEYRPWTSPKFALL
jgi:hypothetical protein